MLRSRVSDAPTVLSTKARTRIVLYLGGLIMLLGLGGPANALIDLPISFFLKDKLHLASSDVANFRLIAAIRCTSGSSLASFATCGVHSVVATGAI